MSSSSASLVNLPQEILGIIMSACIHAGHGPDRYNGCKGVLYSCRDLRANPAVHMCFSGLTLKNEGHDLLEGAMHVFPKHATLQRVHFGQWVKVRRLIRRSYDALVDVHDRFAQVRSLILDDPHEIETAQAELSEEENHARRRSWVALGNELWAIFPSVEVMRLGHSNARNEDVTFSFFTCILRPFSSSLVYLTLEAERIGKIDVVQWLFRNTSNEEDGAPALTFPVLLRLSILLGVGKYDSEEFYDDGHNYALDLSDIAKNCPRLERLDLEMYGTYNVKLPNVLVTGLPHLVRNCPGLSLINVPSGVSFAIELPGAFREQKAIPSLHYGLCALQHPDDSRKFLAKEMKTKDVVVDEFLIYTSEYDILDSRRAVQALVSLSGRANLTPSGQDSCAVAVKHMDGQGDDQYDPEAMTMNDVLEGAQRISFVLGPLARTAYAHRVKRVKISYRQDRYKEGCGSDYRAAEVRRWSPQETKVLRETLIHVFPNIESVTE